MNNQEHQETISLLSACAATCNHCAASCLEEENVASMAKCIQLDMDCAEICTITAAYLSRGSEYADSLMKICAEICEACAAECEKHKQMDHCTECAKICRQCAEACSQSV